MIAQDDVSKKFRDMGWRVDEGRYLVRAICPGCQATENLGG